MSDRCISMIVVFCRDGFARDEPSLSPTWGGSSRDYSRALPPRKSPPATQSLKQVTETTVSLSRRLTDNIIELLHRLASSAADNERLKSIIESSKPHIEALESASVSSYERAQALVAAETKVSELRGTSPGSAYSHTYCFSGTLLNVFRVLLLMCLP